MDEATANIDVNTEQIIQKLISSEFLRSTVITIAHRLNTITNSDKVILMENGEVIEYDQTSNLIQNPNSKFYSLIQEFNK